MKKIIFSLLLVMTAFIAGCSSDSADTSNGDKETPTVTPIDVASNALSLLGTYEIDNYTISGGSIQIPTSESKLYLDVLVDPTTNPLGVYVFMRVELNDDTTYIDNSSNPTNNADIVIPIDTATLNPALLNAFIDDVFTELNAEVIEPPTYNLTFTIDPSATPSLANIDEYDRFIDVGILQAGETLKINATKIQDADSSPGIDAPPFVPVTSIDVPNSINIDTKTSSTYSLGA